MAAPAVADFRRFESLPVDRPLEAEIARIAQETLAEFAAANLKPGNLSITIVDLTGEPRRASFEGGIPYHPASVVKAFYLLSAYDQIAKRRLKLDEPLRKAFQDMIVESSNDATSYVVDRISGTTSGPELYGRAYDRFVHRRNLMNRYFRTLGYDISANGKTWCEGVYGREKQILGPNREHRNRVTSDAVAAMMLWIARREAVSRSASEEMLALMSRKLDPAANYSQVAEFSGEALPAGSRLWSKAGWTSEVRHDAGYVELPNGRRYVVAILTRGTGDNSRLLPAISAKIVTVMSSR